MTLHAAQARESLRFTSLGHGTHEASRGSFIFCVRPDGQTAKGQQVFSVSVTRHRRVIYSAKPFFLASLAKAHLQVWERTNAEKLLQLSRGRRA